MDWGSWDEMQMGQGGGWGEVGWAIELAPAELADFVLELADGEFPSGPDVALCGAVVCSGWDGYGMG